MQDLSSEMQLLISTSIFRGIGSKDFMGMDLLWEIRTIRAGNTLWYQGQSASELAIVVNGTLRVCQFTLRRVPVLQHSGTAQSPQGNRHLF